MTTIDAISSEKAELSRLNALFIKNFLTNDTESHDKLIHSDFVYISNAGKIVNRKDYMIAWAHGYNPEVDKSFEYTDESIRIFGNMALICCQIYYSFIEQGQLVFKREVYTDTYVKENNEWRCVQAQLTVVK